MSHSRMFTTDAPDDPAGKEPQRSPRTTIVGARPPEPPGTLPHIPTGMEHLLRLAAADPAFRRALVERRADIAAAAGVALTPTERAMLTAAPASHLDRMVGGLPTPSGERASSLARAAATALAVVSGAVLGCGTAPGPGAPGSTASSLAAPAPPRPTASEMNADGGHTAEAPAPRPDVSAPPTAGVTPDPAPPRPKLRPPLSAGISPTPPPDQHTRGIRPDIPPARDKDRL